MSDVAALALLAVAVLAGVAYAAWGRREDAVRREYDADWTEFVDSVTALAKAGRRSKMKRAHAKKGKR